MSTQSAPGNSSTENDGKSNIGKPMFEEHLVWSMSKSRIIYFISIILFLSCVCTHPPENNNNKEPTHTKKTFRAQSFMCTELKKVQQVKTASQEDNKKKHPL